MVDTVLIIYHNNFNTNNFKRKKSINLIKKNESKCPFYLHSFISKGIHWFDWYLTRLSLRLNITLLSKACPFSVVIVVAVRFLLSWTLYIFIFCRTIWPIQSTVVQCIFLKKKYFQVCSKEESCPFLRVDKSILPENR